jgi:hypothetical protein
MMGISFRPIAIFVELAILMGILYSLFTGVKLVIFDLGLDPKYSPFIKWVLRIMGFLALVFFAAHLITFYPRISPTSRF